MSKDCVDGVVNIITVGRLVEVASRTWPGINKPGGVAKVTNVYFDEVFEKDNGPAIGEEKDRDSTHVDVQYVLGNSKEKRVPIEYVQIASQYEEISRSSTAISSLRDRSLLLGRCLNCGSLRMDCGSCDWALEEEQVSAIEKTSNHPSNNNDNNNAQTSRKMYPKIFSNNHKRYRRSRSNELSVRNQTEGSSGDDSDGSHDTIELQKLIRQARRIHRKGSRYKKYSTREENNSKLRQNHRVVNSSSSLSSSSEVEKLNHPKRRKVAVRSVRTRTLEGKSILESLPSCNKLEVLSSSSESQINHSSMNSSSDESDRESSSEQTFPLTSQIRLSDTSETDVDIDMFQLDGNAHRIERGSQNSYHQQLLILESRAKLRMEHQQGEHEATGGEFIQPEGEEAIENLPNDMVDMSKMIPYADLGSFFDTMITKIEDDMLPDLRLKAAELHRQLIFLKYNEGTTDCTKNKNDDSNSLAKQLLKKYDLICDEVCLSLIQNGTDQCRVALRRLMDDRLYRKHRKNLTSMQRKKCRSGIIMDARNLRMDNIDGVVETFFRKLKESVELCEGVYENDATEINKIDSCDDNYDDKFESSDEESSLDLIPISEIGKESNGNSMNPSELPHAPFDPHSYAQRVRKNRVNECVKETHTTLTFPKSMKDSNVPKKRSDSTETPNISIIQYSRRTETSDNSYHQASFPTLKNSGRRRMHRLVDKKASASNDRAVSVTHRGSKRSISDRMQDFLDANSENKISDYCRDTDESGQLIPESKPSDIISHRKDSSRSQTKNTLSCSRNKNSRISVRERNKHVVGNREKNDVVIQNQGAYFTSCDTETLFTQILTKSKQFEEIDGGNDTLDVANIEENHTNTFSEYTTLLRDMEFQLSEKGSMNVLLHKAYNMIVSRGSRTVQDMIASGDDELSPHLRMLSLCVRSLNYVSDENLPLIFTKSRRNIFFDLLVLQMIDALYSMSIPSAWALTIQNRDRVISTLNTLRNALAQSIPLFEVFCRCVLQSFGCQQWRKHENSNHLFVSAIDPRCWRDFLQSGIIPENPQVSRYQKLNRFWPRIETDAMWRILAFTAAVKSDFAEKSLFRFQLISKLFSSGVLSTYMDEDGINLKLPPDENQILACQQEISYFSALINSGNLDPLPASDSILIKLIKLSLELQSNSYEGDDGARASCFPNTDERMMRKKSSLFWSISHPLYLDQEDNICCHVPISDFPIHDKNDGSFHELLYPSSRLLTSCISLAVKWINHIPRKKVRQNRLIKSLKALHDNLLEEAITNKTEISFEDAFSLQFSPEIGIGSERVSVFKQEAAAYLQIIESMSIHNKIDIDSTMIWRNVSDDDMKRRQINILNVRNTNNNYNGDAYRLLMATKVMTAILCVQMNVSPWHASFSKKITRLVVENDEPRTNCVSFVMSCMFGCLDCACDLRISPQVFSQFYEILIFAFHNLTKAMKAREWSISFLIPVLIRCIKVHLGQGLGSSEDHHELHLCLSLVRVIYSCVAARHRLPLVNESLPTSGLSKKQGKSDEDDMWGGIDDSYISAYDLDSAILDSRSNTALQMQLFETLSDALNQSKPSNRFDIAFIGSASTFQMSSIGKFLISKEINEVCDCLSTAIASAEIDDSLSSDLSKLILKWIRPHYEDDEDSEFYSRVGGRLSSKLCLLAGKFPSCQKFVFEHADHLLFHLLGMLMDSSRLERFPTCNIERIRKIAGHSATKQAELLMDIFNGNFLQDEDARLRKLQSRRRKNLTGVWDFCHALGTVIKDDIGGALLKVDSDLSKNFPITEAITLEAEVFRVFQVIRNIISSSVANDISYATFEKLSTYSLMLPANHIMRIVQSLKYHDQTFDTSMAKSPPDREYKKARLSELLSSYVELFISSIAWIIREGSENMSELWQAFQNFLKDRLLSPILKYQTVDLTIALQEVMMSSKFILGVPRGQVALLPSFKCNGIAGCSKYLTSSFFDSTIRRCKIFLIVGNTGLRHAVFEALMGCSNDLEQAISWKIGASVSTNYKRMIANMWPYSSPIQKKIDEYIHICEDKTMKSTNGWQESIAELKRMFLLDQLLPRLNSDAGTQIKRRILRLLSHILEYDNTRLGEPGYEIKRTVDIDVACDIVSAIRSSVQKCLIQLTVDDGLASVVFICSTHLANLVVFVDGERHNFLCWIYQKIKSTGSNEKRFSDLSSLEAQSCYVWVFFQWLQTLGDYIINKRGDLTKMRKQLSDSCSRNFRMDEDILKLQLKDFDTWNQILLEFESLRAEIWNNRSVVNIYAKSSNKNHDQGMPNKSFKPWFPSNAVKKNLKELVAIIITNSYQ